AESKNPYKLSDIMHSSRCPQCAGDMEDGDVICLTCGYNTQTRQRTFTVKAYESTTLDWTIWWLPGIGCALLTLALIGTIVYLWVGIIHLDDKGELVQWKFAMKIWGSVIATGLGWITGKFAFKRLILHSRPPEKLMR